MDLSSLTEAQQQQLQQLHQQFQQHQLQQQQQQQLQEQQQQQQQQQIQQQQQQQQQIQQLQQQELVAQSYDPSQYQAYDQATQAYYSYYQYPQQQQSQEQQYQPQEQQQQPQEQHQQYYPYYQPDYANAYQQQPQTQPQPQPQPQSQPQPQPQPQSQPQLSQPDQTAIHPPGISIPSDPSQAYAAATAQVQGQAQGQAQKQVQHQHQHQPNVYYPQGAGEQQNTSYPVPPGLNPAAAAAVAALSQLTQFAGTMDAAERAMAELHERQWHAKNGGYGPMMPGQGPMPIHHGPIPFHPPVGRSPYRGNSRRGGGPSRGGGRGNFGHRHSRPDGSGSGFRGRGRMGRDNGRRFKSHASASTSPHSTATLSQEPLISAEGEAVPSDGAPGEAPQVPVQLPSAPTPGQASVPGQSTPAWRPQIAWCELCRVDCTSWEILEQHKSGKKHKKNLQRFEELQNVKKPVAEIQIDKKPMPEFKPEAPVKAENDQGGEENKPPSPENLPAEAGTDENKMETEQQNDSVEQPEITEAEPTEAPARRPRMDRFEGRRHGMKRKMWGSRGGKRMRISEGPRRPVEPPKPKEVVPLICDLCDVKCDTQAVFDCHLAGRKHLSKIKRFHGHQSMYRPMGLQSLYPANPIAQSAYFIPQGHQPVIYGTPASFPRPAAYWPPRAGHVAATAGPNPRAQKNSQLQESQITMEPGSQEIVMVETTGQQGSATAEPESQYAAKESRTDISISENERKEAGIPFDNSIVPPLENVVTGAAQVLPASDAAVSLPEYVVTSVENVSLSSGLEIKTGEPESKKEIPTEQESALQ